LLFATQSWHLDAEAALPPEKWEVSFLLVIRIFAFFLCEQKEGRDSPEGALESL